MKDRTRNVRRTQPRPRRGKDVYVSWPPAVYDLTTGQQLQVAGPRRKMTLVPLEEFKLVEWPSAAPSMYSMSSLDGVITRGIQFRSEISRG